MEILYVLLGASLTINMIIMFSWKIMMKSIKQEVEQFKIQLENKYQNGGK